MQFHCRNDHTFSYAVLDAAQDKASKAALGTALRALEERISLAHRMRDSGRHDLVTMDAEAHVGLLRGMLE